MNTEDQDCGHSGNDEIELSIADKWILSRLQHTVAAVSKSLDGYRFDHAAQSIYEFIWTEYCDWYLELSKPVLNAESSCEAAKRGTRKTLIDVLEALLRMTHPIMPFITEEIWQRVAPLAGIEEKTIMLQPYPVSESSLVNNDAENQIQWLKQFILGIRQIRGEMNISPGKPLPVMLENASEQDKTNLELTRHYLDFLAKTESVTLLNQDEDAPESATALVGNMKILIPLAGLIDKQAELDRLNKEIGKISAEMKRLEGKLGNPNFVDKAPEAVVSKEKTKLASAQEAFSHLNDQLNKISAL